MAVMLAHVKPAQLDPAGWMMSEKFDGVRAYWDGVSLISRSGRRINAPAWFTASLPPFPVDGELYMGRRTMAKVSGLSRAATPSDAWRNVTYMLFDAPKNGGGFASRIEQLKAWKATANTPHVRIVEHIYCDTRAHLASFFQTVRKHGGEGVILRGPGSLYCERRSWEYLKVRNRKFI